MEATVKVKGRMVLVEASSEAVLMDIQNDLQDSYAGSTQFSLEVKG